MEELNKKQVKSDLIFFALKIAKAHKELEEMYLRIQELYEGITED